MRYVKDLKKTRSLSVHLLSQSKVYLREAV